VTGRRADAAAPAARRDGWRVWIVDPGVVPRGFAGGGGAAAASDAGATARPGDDVAATAATWLACVDRLAGTPPCHRSKHATTYRLDVGDRRVYVKRYHRYRIRSGVKDLVRPSKARHVARISAALAAAGFRVPAVVAAAERRRGPLLVDAWVATASLDGTPLSQRLARLSPAGASRAAAPGTASPHAGSTASATRGAVVADKRRLLAALGAEVGRLHARGFVAGDLVPPNVWLLAAARPEAAPAIAFLDHDRTRAGRAPARWRRARRNLVQLNRIPIPGVLATDRLRVYRAYARARGWSRDEARRRLPWIITKTIERRRRFDGVADAAGLGFRALMRAERSGT
jgi:tRNA A-37 threonylcarbamoyl transferase component Bud32